MQRLTIFLNYDWETQDRGQYDDITAPRGTLERKGRTLGPVTRKQSTWADTSGVAIHFLKSEPFWTLHCNKAS